MTAQQQLTQTYGPPGPIYLAAHCHIWPVRQDFPWFPATRLLINTRFQAILSTAFQALYAAGLHTEITSCNGCYDDRNVRGTALRSLHAWAAAIDLNATTNPMHLHPTVAQRSGSWSLSFIATMKAAGLFFGGDFHHRADPMHWAMLDG